MKKSKAELQNIITFLESKLDKTQEKLQIYENFYEQHKSCCNQITPQPDHHHDEIQNITPICPPPSDTSGGQIDGARKRKQWENIANELLVTTKKSRLYAVSYNGGIIAALVGGTSYDSQSLLPTLDSATDPISAAERYAKIASGSRARADLVSRVASFQDLIFHSMCAVLEDCGYPTNEIDGVMRIRSSDSTSKNLKRLRAGAVWANEVIATSTGGEWTPLSDVIAEFYFKCE
jgi:hypothetical protein